MFLVKVRSLDRILVLVAKILLSTHLITLHFKPDPIFSALKSDHLEGW